MESLSDSGRRAAEHESLPSALASTIVEEACADEVPCGFRAECQRTRKVPKEPSDPPVGAPR